MKNKKLWRAAALLLCLCLLCVPLMGMTTANVGGLDSAVAYSPSKRCDCKTQCTQSEKSKSCSVCCRDISKCEGKKPTPPICNCTDKCLDSAKNQNCPLCKANITDCTGKKPTPPPTPVCNCADKCKERAANQNCPLCKTDITGCTGKEAPPPAPVCACDVKCTGTALNADCPVCVAKIEDCKGKPPVPVCNCAEKCKAGAVKADCPVCVLKYTDCKGKETTPPPAAVPSYAISILAPDRWYTKNARVEIRMEDENGTGWKKVEAKVERNGSAEDLTDAFAGGGRVYTTISENCTLYVTVTDKSGKAYTKSRYIECFDRTAPTIKTGISGKVLRAEANDELSGVEAIYIDGERYDDLTNGTIDVRLRDLGDDYDQLSVQSVDYAGNKSKTVQVKNPNYKAPGSSTPPASTPAPTPTPTPAPAPTPAPSPSASGGTGSANKGGTTTGTSDATVPTTPPPTEVELGTPLSGNGNAIARDLLYDKYTNKQFITVETRNGNLFYVVIDYDKPTDEAGEQYETYFLNLVDERDLADIIEDENAPVVCACADKCEAGAVNTECPICAVNMTECVGKVKAPAEPEKPAEPTPEPEAPKGGVNPGLILLLVLALMGGGAFYYIKFIKNKPKAKAPATLDDYDFEEDEKPEGTVLDESDADEPDADEESEDRDE